MIALGCALLGCGPRRPSSLANLPGEVDVVFVPVQQQELQALGFLQPAAPGPREFAFKAPENPKIAAEAIEQVSCTPKVFGSVMCPSVEVKCNAPNDELRVELELRRDGWVSVRLGPPWETTPQDLVETRLLVKADPMPPSSRATLSAQLVEGIVDSSSLQLRGQFRKADSPWFNQVSTEGDEIFVAIHETHPYYEQVLLSLSLIGKLWAANSTSFVDCGFSR